MEATGIADPLYLQWPETGGASNPKFQGLIKLSLNRYLHVDVDFLLNEPRIQGIGGTNEPFDRGRDSIRFQASRRMRSGELHYLDHPRMGMLIEIRRYEPPPPPEPEVRPETPVVTSPANQAEPTTQPNPPSAE